MWPLSNDECYVSIDIEADGPIPGAHSMLSLGAATSSRMPAGADVRELARGPSKHSYPQSRTSCARGRVRGRGRIGSTCVRIRPAERERTAYTAQSRSGTGHHRKALANTVHKGGPSR